MMLKKATGLKDKGNDLLKAGEMENAISKYSMAIRLAPTEHTFYSNRSAAYLKYTSLEHNFKLALKDAQKCVEMAPEWSKAYTRLGAAYYSLKMMKSALQAYERAVALEPGNQATESQLEDVKARAEKSKYTLEQEEEWLKADNRKQVKDEACSQQ